MRTLSPLHMRAPVLGSWWGWQSLHCSRISGQFVSSSSFCTAALHRTASSSRLHSTAQHGAAQRGAVHEGFITTPPPLACTAQHGSTCTLQMGSEAALWCKSCNEVQGNVLCFDVLLSTTRHSIAGLCLHTPQVRFMFNMNNEVVLYCIVPYCTALYCSALYRTGLYCTALYCIVPYCTAL